MLRAEIYAHFEAGNPLGLGLCQRPTGAAEWRPSADMQVILQDHRHSTVESALSEMLDSDPVDLVELNVTNEQRQVLGY